jgi:hypothetical protein
MIKKENIEWITHPKEIGCCYSLIKINDIEFELTVNDTFMQINSLIGNMYLDAHSMNDSKHKAIKFASIMAKS